MNDFDSITVCALIEDILFLDVSRQSSASIGTLLREGYHLPEKVSSILRELWERRPLPPLGAPAALLYGLDRFGLRLRESAEWLPLHSIFATDTNGWFSPDAVCRDEELHIPGERQPLPDGRLDALCSDLRRLCCRYEDDRRIIPALFDFLEDRGSFLSPDGGAHSLFEIAKLRAGGVACLCFTQYEQNLFPSAGDIIHQSCILVCSFDFLGIKDFKFQSAYADDLRLVTAASFYVDLFRENLLDDFLDAAGLSRCNLIFTGGRHLHMFLPNTTHIRELLKNTIQQANDWLADQFGLHLYVSFGVCAVDGFMDQIAFEARYYLDVFTEIANQKALMESHKYTAENLSHIGLCFRESKDLSHREWMQYAEDRFSDEAMIAVYDDPAHGIPIGAHRYASEWNGDCKGLIRLYGRKGNCWKTDLKTRQIGIWHQSVSAPAFCFSPDVKGEYGLFRMDIDNFRSNMLSSDEKDLRRFPAAKMEYSRQLAYFLRRDVPRLLKNYLRSHNEAPSAVLSVIHEGADDMFIFGELHHLLRFTAQMYLHYRQFTLGRGSFSAGICVYDFKKTLIQNAQTAQQLLDLAKTVPGKNAVAIKDSSSVFSWEDLIHHGTDFQDFSV